MATEYLAKSSIGSHTLVTISPLWDYQFSELDTSMPQASSWQGLTNLHPPYF